MSIKNRLAQLEKRNPPINPNDPAQMKPSEILARVDELLATARQRKAADPTTRYSSGDSLLDGDIVNRIDSLRRMVNREHL